MSRLDSWLCLLPSHHVTGEAVMSICRLRTHLSLVFGGILFHQRPSASWVSSASANLLCSSHSRDGSWLSSWENPTLSSFFIYLKLRGKQNSHVWLHSDKPPKRPRFWQAKSTFRVSSIVSSRDSILQDFIPASLDLYSQGTGVGSWSQHLNPDTSQGTQDTKQRLTHYAKHLPQCRDFVFLDVLFQVEKVPFYIYVWKMFYQK